MPTTEKDTEKRKNEFLRARSSVARAKEIGANSERIQLMLESIPADGNIPTLTTKEKRSPA